MSLNSQQKPGGFFDKNTLIAISLSFAVFALWQTYVAKKYPPASKESTAVVQTPVNKDEDVVKGKEQNTTAEVPKDVPGATADLAAPEKEEFFTLDFPEYQVELSSYGMGIKSLTLKKYLDRQQNPIRYAVGEGLNRNLVATSINGQDFEKGLSHFKIEKVSETKWKGTARVGETTVVKTMDFSPEKFYVQINVELESATKAALTVATLLNNKIQPASKSFLLPSYEHQEFFVKTQDKNDRNILDPEKQDQHDYSDVVLSSLNEPYFSLLLVNRTENLFPKSNNRIVAAQGYVEFTYTNPSPQTQMNTEFDFYFGPKDMDILASVDEDFKDVIDYGMFSFIGRPLLWLLKFLQNFLQNWGFSIIVLTLIIRVLLLPMNVYSFKAMRKMQKIQPLLKDIKEKYKNDPQRANQETIQLMKREKANPLSGCLPALAQIPIFFALYSVLGKSIELYKQPFFFWIHDLSLKDPFFILPILVGLTFFVQQKVTPTTTMDPAQQKVLMFMPIVFSLFMLSTPSGLTLYMFVNGLFGVVQQLILMKEKTI